MRRLTLHDLGYASDAFGAAWPVRLFDAATFATLRAAASAPTQTAVMRGLAARDPAVDAAWRAVNGVAPRLPAECDRVVVLRVE